MKLAPAWLVVCALAAASALGCNGKTVSAGGLELIIATDLQTPQDFDTLHVAISQQTEPGMWKVLLNVDFRVPAEKKLPASISIAAGTSSDQEALIDVVALKGGPLADGGVPVVLREAQVQVPSDRVAEMYLLLSSACVGKVVVTGGVVTSSCPDPTTSSCQPTTGACGSSTVDASTLPAYSPADVLGEDASVDAASDASVSGDGTAGSMVPDAPGTLDAPATVDAPGVVDAPGMLEETSVTDGPSSSMEAASSGGEAGSPETGAPMEGGPTCMASGPCDLGACQIGANVCANGTPACMSTGTIQDGTPCGSAAGMVCHMGNCIACNAGGDCSDMSAPCVKKSYVCTTGTAVCTPMGNVTDGMGCGSGLYCNGGVCSACVVGAPCTPPSAPCHTGQVSACPGGMATCADSMVAATDGTSCGVNKVCFAGACDACTAGLTCTPTNVCHTGTTTCASGQSACTDSFMAGNGGTSCGANKVCSAGQCITQLTVSGGSIAGTQTVAFSGSIGTVSDANMGDPASALTAVIAWGDGTATSAGSISGGAGSFTVAGGHTYAASGTYSGTLTVADPTTGSSAAASFTATIGMCVPMTTDCSGNTPQLCSAAGQWQNQTACTGGFTCASGACSCSLTTCGAACVNPMTNTSNCGTCGHACPGACAGGSCQCVTAGGGSLLQNGGFDANVASWTSLDPNIVLTHSTLDAAACGTSGSVLASNQAPMGLNSGFLQCVPVTAGTSYNAGGWVRVPSGGAHGQTFFQVAWFTGANCQGTLTLGALLSQSGDFDTWELVSKDNLVAPAGTVSAYFYGQIIKNFTDTLSYQVYFDDLYLTPSPGHF